MNICWVQLTQLMEKHHHWDPSEVTKMSICWVQLTQLMEKRETVHAEVLTIEQSSLKIAAEAAFVVSPLFSHGIIGGRIQPAPNLLKTHLYRYEKSNIRPRTESCICAARQLLRQHRALL